MLHRLVAPSLLLIFSLQLNVKQTLPYTRCRLVSLRPRRSWRAPAGTCYASALEYGEPPLVAEEGTSTRHQLLNT